MVALQVKKSTAPTALDRCFPVLLRGCRVLGSPGAQPLSFILNSILNFKFVDVGLLCVRFCLLLLVEP